MLQHAVPPSRPGLLAVHAHPDDEVISTGGVLASAAAAGHRTMVVTCTDGARGEVVGEGMDPAEIGPRLAEVRRQELAAALAHLQVAEHRWLGYADSGMMGDEGNDAPGAFWRADVHDAVGRLVAIIREFRPAVLVTYDAFGGYGHPDHIQTHRVALLASEAAGMAALYPKSGAPWITPKIYFASLPKGAIAAANQLFLDRGLPSPFGESTDPHDIPMGTDDSLVTTTVDVSAVMTQKRAALKAHASQIAPDSFFLNVPDDMMGSFYGTEWFVRHRSTVAAPDPEDDLFAGLV